jgi:hypothetical protein
MGNITAALFGHKGEIAEEVDYEIGQAEKKFGRQLELNDLEWQSILLEEVGEAASLVTKGSVRPATDPYLTDHPEELRGEIVQVAAVAIRWIDAIDERMKKERDDT